MKNQASIDEERDFIAVNSVSFARTGGDEVTEKKGTFKRGVRAVLCQDAVSQLIENDANLIMLNRYPGGKGAGDKSAGRVAAIARFETSPFVDEGARSYASINGTNGHRERGPLKRFARCAAAWGSAWQAEASSRRQV
jgi:hypothetical protein